MTLDAQFEVGVGAFTLSAEVHARDGEMLAIVGPNGAGKTTLLRALAGLVPIDSGSVSIAGAVVDDPARDTFVPPNLRSIGVVFQDYLLFEHLDVTDNVAFGLRERGMRKAAARDRARALLARVGVEDQAAKRPRELSGGQAQRVALARALAIEPALLLLDEPLAALDVQARAETRRELRSLLGDFRGARILVTHDPVDAFTLADRIVILERGLVTQSGTIDDIVEHPRSEYVAELVGVNLYRGRADDHGVVIGSVTVAVAESHTGDVVVTIPPRAVVLHRAPPAGSARNAWSGTVVATERLAERVRVRIEGPIKIVAEITPGSLAELDLREGTQVWAAVKATEVNVYPS